MFLLFSKWFKTLSEDKNAESFIRWFPLQVFWQSNQCTVPYSRTLHRCYSYSKMYCCLIEIGLGTCETNTQQVCHSVKIPKIGVKDRSSKSAIFQSNFWTTYNGYKSIYNRCFAQFFRVQKLGKKMRQNGIFRHLRLKVVLIVLIRWCGYHLFYLNDKIFTRE
jgi:hypothetical protein